MGQMLRGGRSGPPDWNVGAGASRSANCVAPAVAGSGSWGTALGSGVAEQNAEHMVHLLSWPAPLSWRASPAWPW